jgi:hypothetical protein
MPATCLLFHTSRFDLPNIWLKDLGKATRLRAERFGVRIPFGARNFSPLWNVPVGTGTSRGLLLSGYRCSCPGVQRPGSELDQSRPSIAEDKKEWSCTSTSLYTFMARTETTVLLVRFGFTFCYWTTSRSTINDKIHVRVQPVDSFVCVPPPPPIRSTQSPELLTPSHPRWQISDLSDCDS